MLPKIEITEMAKSRAMCLLSLVKSELSITDSSSDTRIERMIRAVSLHLASELGRDPWLQTYSEKRPGQGGQYLYLSRFPLKGSPASVTFGTGDDPDTVDADDYSVAGRRRDRLYRSGGWNRTGVEEGSDLPNLQALPYSIAYPAGWVMPDQVDTAWAASTAYSVGDWLQDQSDLDYPLIFEATTAGTSAGSEPSWSTLTADGDTLTDGTVVWTAREQRLPEDLEEAALMLAANVYGGGWRQPTGIRREGFEGAVIEYMEQSPAMSAAIQRIVRAYR